MNMKNLKYTSPANLSYDYSLRFSILIFQSFIEKLISHKLKWRAELICHCIRLYYPGIRYYNGRIRFVILMSSP